jgi:hypothetical protein
MTNNYALTRSYDHGNETRNLSYNEVAYETIIELADKQKNLHIGAITVTDGDTEMLYATIGIDGTPDRVLLTYTDNAEFVATILQLEEHQWDLNTDGSFVSSNDEIKPGQKINVTHLYK